LTTAAADELFSRIADRLKALSDPMRLKILHSLEERELCVGDVLARVGGSQANVSKHLALLRRARREGTSVFYRVVDPAAFEICRTVCSAIERRAEEERAVVRRGQRANRRR
jgi:DNA-binding transcriptional ArsR family regulator